MSNTDGEETNIDMLTRRVINHLNDYAIKGVLVREDVNNMVIESRLAQKELASLREQLAKLQERDKQSISKIIDLEGDILELREQLKEMTKERDGWISEYRAARDEGERLKSQLYNDGKNAYNPWHWRRMKTQQDIFNDNIIKQYEIRVSQDIEKINRLKDQLKQKEGAIENLNKLLCKHNLKIVAMDSGELDMINISA